MIHEFHIWHTSPLGVTAIQNRICCHGDPFTMTTEKYLHYFAVWRHTNFIFVHTYLWATAIHSSICCYVNPVALLTKTYFSNHFIWGHMSFVFNMNAYWDDNSVSNHGMLSSQWLSTKHGPLVHLVLHPTCGPHSRNPNFGAIDGVYW